MGWLEPLRQVVERATVPVDFFFRIDDVGWEDDRLFPLLDLFEQRAVPVDLAVIPQALTPGTAAELRARLARSPDRMGVHLHGFAHVNHEPDGRKSEFGPRREVGAQRRDLEAGRHQLELLLGDAVAPFFTPPWNRCTESTARLLAELGFRVLSRDARERPFGIPGFLEIPVRVDWLRPPADVAATGERLAVEGRSGSPVGIMLHPARIDAEQRRWLGALLALLGSHVGSRCRSMRSLANDRFPEGKQQ